MGTKFRKLCLRVCQSRERERERERGRERETERQIRRRRGKEKEQLRTSVDVLPMRPKETVEFNNVLKYLSIFW